MKKIISIFTSIIILLSSTFALSSCGKKEAHQTLIDYLVEDAEYLGKGVYGDVSYHGGYELMILYDKTDDCLSITLFTDNYNSVSLKDISKDNGSPTLIARYVGNSSYSCTGYINRRYVSRDNVNVKDFATNAPSYLKSELKEFCELGTSLLLSYTDSELEEYDIGVRLYDLGFKKFK